MNKTLSAASFVSVAALLTAAGMAAPPLNDNRANAITLTMGLAAAGVLTEDTTYEAGSVPSVCAGEANMADVWYKVNAAAGTWRLSLCGSGFDTVVQVFNNNGNQPGAIVGCNDDFCGTSSQVDIVNNASSGLYWVRVAGKAGGNGNFAIAPTFVSGPPVPPVEIPTPNLGPDVTIGNLSDVGSYGTGLVNGVSYRAYAVGTDSWNIGDRYAVWISGNNQHPVIGQQMYRLKNGRFEQLGASWVKHGFLSTNSQAFSANMNYPSATNRTCVTPPVGGAGLGVNCSDLYGSGLNGSRSYLGPRYDINPITGVFTYPWNPLVNNFTPADGSDTISRRLLVKASDIGDTTARYFVDAVYFTQDDAQWNNGRNNYSYREVQAANATTFIGNTVRRKAAIEVWPTIDSSVTLVPVDFHEITTTVNDTLVTPNIQRTFDVQGRFFVASKVTDNLDGSWNYEYAVMNVNSHRGASRFALPGGNLPMTNVGFNAPIYHSGDRVNNDPWVANSGTGFKSWDTDMEFPATTTIPGAPVNAATVSGVGPNYIRWGMLYNYRFTSTLPPRTGYARLGLGRPPANATGFQGSILNVPGIQVPSTCLADVAGSNQSVGGDGNLTADDVIVFLGAFFGGDLWGADVAGANQATLPDGVLTADDIIVYLGGFFAGCQ